MSTEQRSSFRISPTPKAIEDKNKGIAGTRFVDITSAGPGGEQVLNIPLRADFILMKNVGANPIRFVFDGTPIIHYYELLPNESVSFGLANGKDLRIRAVNGPSSIRAILWG